MEQQVTNLINRTSGTDFYDHRSGEISRVHRRLAVPETRNFRVGNLQLGLPADVMSRAHGNGGHVVSGMYVPRGKRC